MPDESLEKYGSQWYWGSTQRPATPLEPVVDNYLSHCRARGVSPRTNKQHTYSLRAIFLPWCDADRITDLAARWPGARPVHLLPAGPQESRCRAHLQPLGAHYIRPVRLLLTWAAREGEEDKAESQLPRRERPLRDRSAVSSSISSKVRAHRT